MSEKTYNEAVKGLKGLLGKKEAEYVVERMKGIAEQFFAILEDQDIDPVTMDKLSDLMREQYQAGMSAQHIFEEKKNNAI